MQCRCTVVLVHVDISCLLTNVSNVACVVAFLRHSKASIGVVLGSIFSILIVVGVIVIIVAFWCSKRAKALESKERLAARMSGMCDESEITVRLSSGSYVTCNNFVLGLLLAVQALHLRMCATRVSCLFCSR